MSRAVAFLLILVLAVPACYATEHTVGDSTGWDTSGDYATWASGKTFNVGDSLLFVYGTSHGVDEVKKGDYDSCTSTSAISSANDGNTSISLSTTGPHYFICPSANHCTLGMKLAITVSAATATTPASPPSMTPSPQPSSSSSSPPPPPDASPTIPSAASTPPPDTSPNIPSASTPPTTSITTPTSNNGNVKRMDALLLFGASLVLALLLMA